MPKNFIATRLLCLTAIIVVAAAASLVPAADVYMLNGKRYQGVVTTKGDKVIIEMAHGTITVNQSDILTIQEADLPQTTTKVAPLSTTKPATDPASLRTTAGEMQMPESYAFMYMRNIVSGAISTNDNRKMVQNWQAKAHDRMRRDGTEKEWAAPAEFDRRRLAFTKLLNDSAASMKVVKSMLSLTPTTNPVTEKDRDRAKRAQILKANEQFLQAAQAWPDPLLRKFLMGIARTNAGEHAAALDDYRKCCADAPRVAAFHQGYAMSLLSLDRPLDAMDQCLQVLRLQPDSADAVSALCKAMAAVKGNQMKSDPYLQAAKALRDYTDPVAKPASSTINWATPGKSVSSKDGSLPVMNFDRLVFRQAIAVPIAEHVLLVDRQLIDRSLEQDVVDVFVRIDDKTIVPGKFHKIVGSTMAAKADSPFAVVTVDDCTFTPATINEKPGLALGQSVSVEALSIFEEMGSKPRTISANAIKLPGEDEVVLSQWLAPGEAAGPILLSGSGIVGFVAGKTDATVESGGPDKIIPVADVVAAAKKSKQYRSPTSGSGQAKRKPTPSDAKGTTFIVYATAGEVIK